MWEKDFFVYTDNYVFFTTITFKMTKDSIG